jgi:hypothetical protein
MTFASADERDRWFFREGAQLSIALDFERLYRTVWASQMELLGAASCPGGIPFTEVQRRYAVAAQSAPQVYSAYSMEQWLGYLKNAGFIIPNGTNIAATDKAALFIQYLVAMHYDLHGLRHDL